MIDPAIPETLRAKRPGPARRHDWEAVMARFELGHEYRAISAALGIPMGSVSRIVRKSRERGDPRATWRRAPPYWADPRQMPLPFPAAPAEAVTP